MELYVNTGTVHPYSTVLVNSTGTAYSTACWHSACYCSCSTWNTACKYSIDLARFPLTTLLPTLASRYVSHTDLSHHGGCAALYYSLRYLHTG